MADSPGLTDQAPDSAAALDAQTGGLYSQLKPYALAAGADPATLKTAEDLSNEAKAQQSGGILDRIQTTFQTTVDGIHASADQAAQAAKDAGEKIGSGIKTAGIAVGVAVGLIALGLLLHEARKLFEDLS